MTSSPDSIVAARANLIVRATDLRARIDETITRMETGLQATQGSELADLKVVRQADRLLSEIDRNLSVLEAMFEAQEAQEREERQRDNES